MIELEVVQQLLARWADGIISLGSICFIVALVPTLLNAVPVPKSTSGLTAFWLWVFSAVFVALELPFSAGITAMTAYTWTMILIQGVLRGRRQETDRR